MLIRRAPRYRIYPTAEQERLLLGWEGILRLLWNLCHEQRLMGLARSRNERVYMHDVHKDRALSQNKQMTELMEEYPWIGNVQCQARQKVLEDLDKAWTRCFKRIARQPRWKSASKNSMSIYIPTTNVPYQIGGSKSNGSISFVAPAYKKLGALKIVYDTPTLGTVKSWTIKRGRKLWVNPRRMDENGKQLKTKDHYEWFIFPRYEVEVPEPTAVNDKVVGIDRGIVNFLADSDGKLTENIRAREQIDQQLIRAQREVDRKKKGSQNQKKARIKVARLLEKAARMRKIAAETAALYYAEHYGIIVVEDLNIANMTASAKGTEEEPGTNVAQKAGLNKAILDTGWGMFADATTWKAEERGGKLVKVLATNSSKLARCPACGEIDPSNRKSQSEYECSKCGHKENADIVAAKEIRQRGIELIESGATATRAPTKISRAKRVPKVAGAKTKKTSRSKKSQNTTVKPTVKQPVEDNLTAALASASAQRPNETGTGGREVSHRNKDERPERGESWRNGEWSAGFLDTLIDLINRERTTIGATEGSLRGDKINDAQKAMLGIKDPPKETNQ